MYEPELRDEVSQGDVFTGVPIAYISVNDQLQATATDLVPATAMLLTHDCEYDKKKTLYVAVAQILPMSQLDRNQQRFVRELRVLSAFPLPATSSGFEESYVDFRRLDRVNKEVMENLAGRGQRIVSLDDEARLALQRAIAVFFGLGRGDAAQNR